ncbi:hypothetical protein, partial [Plasmodium yoelii yoelii]
KIYICKLLFNKKNLFSMHKITNYSLINIFLFIYFYFTKACEHTTTYLYGVV